MNIRIGAAIIAAFALSCDGRPPARASLDLSPLYQRQGLTVVSTTKLSIDMLRLFMWGGVAAQQGDGTVGAAAAAGVAPTPARASAGGSTDPLPPGDIQGATAPTGLPPPSSLPPLPGSPTGTTAPPPATSPDPNAPPSSTPPTGTPPAPTPPPTAPTPGTPPTPTVPVAQTSDGFWQVDVAPDANLQFSTEVPAGGPRSLLLLAATNINGALRLSYLGYVPNQTFKPLETTDVKIPFYPAGMAAFAIKIADADMARLKASGLVLPDLGCDVQIDGTVDGAPYSLHIFVHFLQFAGNVTPNPFSPQGIFGLNATGLPAGSYTASCTLPLTDGPHALFSNVPFTVTQATRTTVSQEVSIPAGSSLPPSTGGALPPGTLPPGTLPPGTLPPLPGASGGTQPGASGGTAPPPTDTGPSGSVTPPPPMYVRLSTSAGSRPTANLQTAEASIPGAGPILTIETTGVDGALIAFEGEVHVSFFPVIGSLAGFRADRTTRAPIGLSGNPDGAASYTVFFSATDNGVQHLPISHAGAVPPGPMLAGAVRMLPGAIEDLHSGGYAAFTLSTGVACAPPGFSGVSASLFNVMVQVEAGKLYYGVRANGTGVALDNDLFVAVLASNINSPADKCVADLSGVANVGGFPAVGLLTPMAGMVTFNAGAAPFAFFSPPPGPLVALPMTGLVNGQGLARSAVRVSDAALPTLTPASVLGVTTHFLQSLMQATSGPGLPADQLGVPIEALPVP